ncbi:MAG: aldolase catalytic domain-containing protein [Myxococcales bacterium]|nr:aldolase catalytic domain-containing protein [Myxococcales bacterium]
MGLDYRVSCCPDGLMTDRRHDVRVLDCSIRDGGCCNEWQFDEPLVRRTLRALSRAGVDWMEIGYRTSEGCASRESCGPWRFCDDDVLFRLVEDTHIKLAVMMDHGRASADDLRPRSESPIGLVRVACYARDTEAAIRTLHEAQDKGYEVMCNVMAVSTCTPQEVDRFLGLLHDSTIPNVALVDSYGALYPHHVRYLVRKYKNWLRPEQRLGIHCHNNQQTAFANTIVAVEEGATLVDATMLGIGRGAGNCPLELLLMWLDSPRYNVEPVLELVEQYAELQQDLRFGYHVPYAIAGWLNDHPKDAIAQMHDDERTVLEFYRLLTSKRPRSRHHRPVEELAAGK